MPTRRDDPMCIRMPSNEKLYPIKVTRCAVAPVIYVFIRLENTIYRYRNTAEGCSRYVTQRNNRISRKVSTNGCVLDGAGYGYELKIYYCPEVK